MNYLSKDGLAYLWGKIKARFVNIENQLPSTISGYEVNTSTGSMELWSQNLNAITKSGIYNAITCTNALYPYATLLVMGYYLDGYCTQIISDVTTGKVATRTMTNWVWSDWKVIV